MGRRGEPNNGAFSQAHAFPRGWQPEQQPLTTALARALTLALTLTVTEASAASSRRQPRQQYVPRVSPCRQLLLGAAAAAADPVCGRGRS